jgi:hypothetical protein
MFYNISNWIIVIGAIICLFCALGGELLGSFILLLIAEMLPSTLRTTILITGIIGSAFALYMHELKPLFYGILWGIPLSIPVSIFRLKTTKF